MTNSNIRALKIWPKRSWRAVLAMSVVLNLGLGAFGLVIQPYLAAAEVASKVAAAKALAAATEQKKIMAVKQRAKLDEKKAVAKAVSKANSRARIAQAAAVKSAVAYANVKADAEQRQAVSNAVAKEKAKARVGRVAVATPFVGLVIAAGFEYSDFQHWKRDQPDGTVQDYTKESIGNMKLVADDVLETLPSWAKFDPADIIETYEYVIATIDTWKD